MLEASQKAAWSKVELYSSAACLAPSIPFEKTDDVITRAGLMFEKNKISADPSTLSDEVTLPLLGIVREVGPRTNRTRRVSLLTGWAALWAAGEAKASVPVYPLKEEALDALLDAQLIDENDVLRDRQKAVELLITTGHLLAAELLSDPSDPIEAEALPIPTPEEPPAPEAQEHPE